MATRRTTFDKLQRERAKRAKASAKREAELKAAQERGLRTRPLGNVLAFAPPLAINEEEVDEIVKRLGAAMDSVSGN